jgi:molecular chaperone DnaJ
MDLYALLGVNRTASTDEIERAYRRLARRYHPGINPGDRVAEDLYRQIQHAYGVLGDSERRREYDRGGARPPGRQIQATVSFEGFDFSVAADGAGAATFSELFSDVFQDAARQAAMPARGVDIEIVLPVSFEQAVRGGRFPLSVVRQERCAICGGAGRIPRPVTVCPVCGGQGMQRAARGHMVFSRACEACDGTGRLAAQTCRGCAGGGVQTHGEVVTVAVPAGAEDGARLALPGRGHAGARGGPPGDLYVTVQVAGHEHFRRVGRDLHVTLPVAVHEAALGAQVRVPTLDGPVQVRVPPGTASGQRLRVRGRGVPGILPGGDDTGDLIVEVQIVLPPVTDDRSRELLREFGRLNDHDVRAHLFRGSAQA